MVDTLNDPTRNVPIETEELPEIRYVPFAVDTSFYTGNPDLGGVSYVAPEFPYGERSVYRPFPIGSTEAGRFNQLGFSNPTALAPDVYEDQRPQTVAQALDEDLVKSLETGANVNAQQRQFNQDQERETLLGGNLARFIGNLIAPMARPEFLQPGFEGQGLYPAILGYSTARANIEKERQDRNAALLKAAAEAGGPAMLDLTTPTIDLVQNVAGAENAIEVINRMKKYLSTAKLGGGLAKVVPALKDVLDFFGISPEITTMEQYKQAGVKLKEAILASKLFGRDVTAAEYDIINEIIASPGWVTGDDELLAKLQGLERSFLDKKTTNTRLLYEGIGREQTERLLRPNPELATED